MAGIRAGMGHWREVGTGWQTDTRADMIRHLPLPPETVRLPTFQPKPVLRAVNEKIQSCVVVNPSVLSGNPLVRRISLLGTSGIGMLAGGLGQISYTLIRRR